MVLPVIALASAIGLRQFIVARDRRLAPRAPGGLELPLRQELACPRAAGGLLPYRRGRHVCRQPVLTRSDPDAANCAYELTFLFAAVVSFVYVKFIRHDRFLPNARAEVRRRAVRDSRPVRVHLPPSRTRILSCTPHPSSLPTAPRPCSGAASSCARSSRAALSHAAADRRRHRADWHSRPVSAH